ncbi:SGNH/GDSL hydrolase family protein [Demequina sediminicola]|uniref:SGNH/GDSL hydrolase family protein n=1 Tax=Demequina sediminicola TaxID=1095026 RepID=UPI000782A6A2|nr:SGNH/GDSL hydrolase family protein [Demequina sediminicola]
MRIAAIGDSFTEGVGDEVDGGGVRGWADVLAAGLAIGLDEPVDYVNVAIRGRLIEPIVNEQLEAVLALDPPPTHLTFNGGGNDMMRPGFGADRAVEYAKRVIDRCAEEGVQLVLLTGGDPTERLPGGATMRRRGAELMEAMLPVVEEHPEIIFVDNWSDAELRRPPYWSKDRLHLNTLGHSRIAARVLTAMGVETDLPTADDELVIPTGARVEAQYYATYVLPWLGRRILRKSSGDGRAAKYPEWTRMSPA